MISVAKHRKQSGLGDRVERYGCPSKLGSIFQSKGINSKKGSVLSSRRSKGKSVGFRIRTWIREGQVNRDLTDTKVMDNRIFRQWSKFQWK